MSTGTIEFSVIVDTKKGVASIKDASGQFIELGNKAEKSGKKGAEGLGSLFSQVVNINQAVELAQKLWQLFSGPISNFVDRASDAQEISSKFLAVFKDEAPAATDFIQKLADDLNRSKTDLRDWMGSFQDTFVPIGFARKSARELSQQLTATTIDLSSFYNRAEPEVILDLNSALVGNHETMKKYGVILTQATLNQELLTMGVRGGIKAATEQEKVMARVNLIMKGTADAHGDAIRTADQFANMSRGFAAVWKDLQEVVGTAIIDAIIPYMRDMADWIKENRERIEIFARKAGEAIGSFISKIIEIGKFIYKWKSEILTIGKLFVSLFAVKKVVDFGIGINKLVGGAKELIGKLKGINSIVGKVGAGFAAFGVGLAIGDFINDITGLQKATAQLTEWEMKLADARSRSRAGLTEKTKKTIFLAAEIRELSKELGTETGSLMKASIAIYQNKEAYEKLSPELKKIVDGFVLSKKELEELTQKQEAAKKAADEAKRKEEELAQAREAARIAAMKEREEIEKYAEKLKLVANVKEDLEKKTRFLMAAIEMSGQDWTDSQEAVESVGKEVQALVDQYKFAGKSIPPELDKLRIKIELAKDVQDKHNEKIETFGDLNSDIYVPGMEQMQESTDLANNSIEAAKDMTSSWLEKLLELGSIANNAFDVISQGVGILQEFGLISEKTATQISNTINTISSGLGDIETGFSQINKDGATFFDKLSGSLGVLSGYASIAITVIGGLISLFTGDGIQKAIDRENAWMNLNEQLNDSIHQLAEEVGTVHAATSMFLRDILTENLSAENFDQYADRVREIQADVIQGTITQAEANKAMGESFSYLAEKAREYGKEGSFYMLQIIRQNRDMGLNVAEIQSYVFDKLNNHVSALSTYMNTMTGSFAENASFLEANILSVFGAFEQEGYSFLEIVGFMGDSFQSLKEKAQAEGVEISGAIKEMINLSDFVSQNETLFQNIEATQQMMKSLGDSTYMTEELFISFGHEAQKQFNQLIAAGAQEKDALRVLTPMLLERIKMAEAYNYQLDVETQALIEKAKKEGVLNEQSMNESEKQIALMEEIVRLLGGEIPYAVDGITRKVSTSMNSITGETEGWRRSLKNTVDDIGDVGQALVNLDDINTRVITGNTIVTEWEKWQEAVKTTDNDIAAIPDTLKMLDNEFATASISIQSVFSSFKKNTSDWENMLKDVKTAMETATDQEIPELEQKYNSILDTMNADTLMFSDYLHDLAAQIGIEIPAEMTEMSEIYSLVMKEMSSNTQGYMIGANGVLTTLDDIIRKQGQMLSTQSGFGSGWGIYNDEEKAEKTAEFNAMTRQFGRNREIILSDKSYIENFYNKFMGIDRNAIIDTQLENYDYWVKSITNYYNRMKRGYTWTGGNDSWGWADPPDIEAATGYQTWLDRPTHIWMGNQHILAGESGRELFAIVPENDIPTSSTYNDGVRPFYSTSAPAKPEKKEININIKWETKPFQINIKTDKNANDRLNQEIQKIFDDNIHGLQEKITKKIIEEVKYEL